MHNICLVSSTPWGTPAYILRAYGNTFSFFTTDAGYGWYYDGTIDLNTWYRLEYKITGGGSSSGTVLVRLNGLDITSSIKSEGDDHSITADNGSLTIETLNYLSIGTYYGQAEAGEWEHVTGFKITDGPDWIGGDNMKFIGTQSENLSKIDGVSVSSINKILGYDF